MLWSNVCLSLMLHILQSSSSHLPAIWLIINFLLHISKLLSPAVIVTRAALGGTLTVLEPLAECYGTGRGQCVHCLCVRVRVSVSPCSHWGSSLCIYTLKFPMTTVVRTSCQPRECAQKASTPPACACNLCKHCVCV